MKINVQVDLTPEEFRKVMGWPDVEPFQQEILAQLKQKIEAGAEGFDPVSLMQPYLAQSVSSMESFQKMMAALATNMMKGGNQK